MELFHVSVENYSDGQRIEVSSGDDRHYIERLKANAMMGGEERLEQYRPSGLPSRRSTLFAFGDMSHAVVYAETTHGGRANYYRVAMPTPSKAPFAIIDFVRRATDPATIIQLASEYWAPTRSWKFWEYLAGTMEILEKVSVSSIDQFALMGVAQEGRNDFSADHALCKQIVAGREKVGD